MHILSNTINNKGMRPMTENTDPPIRLKMKVGNLEFEIECQQEQLEEAVKRILSTITTYSKESIVIPERNLPPPRTETCKSLIQQLWSEGWFSSPHGLGEVHSEMARKGFHYDRTAVAHALVDLMKEGLLTREGRPRRYRYTQKRPPKC
jgi:hypothetical protein